MSGDVHVRFRERLGVRFPRATRLNVYAGSARAGHRVMESVTHFITSRLKLRVNEAKSAVARPQERQFLGFSFTGGRRLRCVIWKQWKVFRRRRRGLMTRGLDQEPASMTAARSHGPWRLSQSKAMHIALPPAYFDALGLPRVDTR